MGSTSQQLKPYNFKSLSLFIKMSKTCCYSTKLNETKDEKLKEKTTVKQSVVIKVSISLILSFIGSQIVAGLLYFQPLYI
jgi:hypothetical protein